MKNDQKTFQRKKKKATLEIWLSPQNRKIVCTTIAAISTLSSLDRLDVEGNNRFVFGFIALVGSIWHRTFCPQQLHPPRSVNVCSFLPCPCLGYASVSRVEKFSFVLLRRFITERELRSRDRFARLISFSKFLFELDQDHPPMYTPRAPRFLLEANSLEGYSTPDERTYFIAI